MSRQPRTRYMRVVRKCDSPIQCASWNSSSPNSRKEDIEYIVCGKYSTETAPRGSLELARYNFEEDFISESVHNLVEDDLPQSLAVHPRGDGLICSFSNSCKLFGLEGLKLKALDKDLGHLGGIGTQGNLVFSADGSRLAAGGKDGHLRVFEWPSLNLLFDQPDGCKFLNSLDISLDGAFLAAIPDGGKYCRVWEIEKSTVVTTIQSSNKNEMFGSCRFSRDGTKPFLFMTISKGGKGAIGVWDMEIWNKVGVKAFAQVPITSFSISGDGKWLAIGCAGGDVRVIEVKKMQTSELVKDAHLSTVTSLQFAPNGRAFLSLSSDSMLRVTKLNIAKPWKEWQIYLLLIGLILASAVLFYIFFEHSDSFWNFPLGRDQPARPPPEAIYGSMSEFDGRESM